MASRRGESASRPSGGRAAPRWSVGWLAALAVCVVLGGCSGGPAYRVIVESESTYRPSETSSSASSRDLLAPGAEATAMATITPDPADTPTEAPTATPTATPTENPEPTHSPDENSESTPSQDADGGSRDGGGSTVKMATAVVSLTNDERQKAGCPPLSDNKTLQRVATAHSEDMAERDFFSHTNPDGQDPGDRATAAGYDGYAGENIAMGYQSAEAVVEAWMDSSGHRENILNCSSTEIGVGVADSSRGLYWTQMFGRG